MTHKLFQEALEAIKNGEQAQARSLLYRLVKMDSNNVDYWLYLSSVLDNKKEILFCINKAIEIDPQNATAIRGLSLLGSNPNKQIVNPIKPIRKRKYPIPEIFSKTNSDVPDKKRSSISRGQKIRLIVFAILGLSFIYIGIWGNPFSNNQAAYILPSWDDLRPLPDTLTPTATSIPATQVPSPDPPTLTPIIIPFEITYTATPRLVDTPHPESKAYDDGLIAYEQEDYPLAIVYFLNHISEFQRDADVHFYLGLSYYQLGEYEEADNAFIRASDIDPEFGLAYLWEVLSKLAYLDNPTIGNKLSLAVKNAPDYYGVYLERGKYFLRHLSMDYALGDLESALELAPDNAEVHLFAANYYFANHRVEEALLSAQTAMGLNSTIPEIYYILSQAYVESSLYVDAIPPLKGFLDFEPENAEAWLVLGKAQLKAGYYNAALTSFDNVENLTKELYDVHLYTGITYIELARFEEAILRLDLAILNTPKSFEAKIFHGVALMGIGDVWEGYLEINSNSSNTLTNEELAVFYYWRGFSLEKLNKSELAKPDWENYLALGPQYHRENWIETAYQALRGNFFTATPTVTPTPTEITPTPTPTEGSLTPTP